MTVTIGRRPSRWALMAFTALLGTATGCAEWPVSNPYDPRSDLTVRIVGPDTVRNYGEPSTYRVVTEPAWRPEWPPLVIEWAGTSVGGWTIPREWLQLQSDGSVVVTPPLGPDISAFPLRATVGPHVAYKVAMVRVPLVQLTTHPCTSPWGSPMVFDYRVQQALCYGFIDSGGQRVLWPHEGAVLQVSARDQAIVSVGTPTSLIPTEVIVQPLTNGSTLLDVVVTTRDGRVWRDSLPVIVRVGR